MPDAIGDEQMSLRRQILTTPAQTLAGAAAQLEWYMGTIAPQSGMETLQSVLATLRRLGWTYSGEAGGPGRLAFVLLRPVWLFHTIGVRMPQRETAMLILARVVYGLAIFWSLLQLVAESGLLPPADARFGGLRGLAVAPTSIELVRGNYSDCALMRALVARYDDGVPVSVVGLIEVAARCEGRSLQP